MKNYAIQRADYVGAVYTVGYVLAATQDEATIKAKTIHRDAWAVEAERADDHIAINQFLDATNRETHLRLQAARS